jgi:hypothetical protein
MIAPQRLAGGVAQRKYLVFGQICRHREMSCASGLVIERICSRR